MHEYDQQQCSDGHTDNSVRRDLPIVRPAAHDLAALIELLIRLDVELIAVPVCEPGRNTTAMIEITPKNQMKFATVDILHRAPHVSTGVEPRSAHAHCRTLNRTERRV